MKPYVGMLVTEFIGSDSYANEIAHITKNAARLTLKNGAIYTLRNSGWYRPVGGKTGYLTLGKAENYRDQSF